MVRRAPAPDGEGGAAPSASAVGIEPSCAAGLGYLHMPEIAVEIACQLGDAAWADALYRELSGCAGKPFLLTTLGFSLHGVVDHALMRLSAVGRRWQTARRHAARAIELCTRLRARPLLAQIHCDAALIAHAERAQATSPAERAELGAQLRDQLERAQSIAAELGVPLPERAARLTVDAAESTPARGDRSNAGLPPAGEDAEPLRLIREGEYWTVGARGALCRVQDNRGMQMLARLVEQPGREIHVLDLSGSPSGADLSDAGEVLDAQARAEYQARLRELRSEMDQASSFNDLGRRERLEQEADALLRELARGFGLGGRARRSASAVERARVNVRRRLTLALRRISAASPELGAHLEASLRTGVFCVYTPRRGAPS